MVGDSIEKATREAATILARGVGALHPARSCASTVDDTRQNDRRRDRPADARSAGTGASPKW
jgi:hypothetical protein